MRFINREAELAALEEWWAHPSAGAAMVWGRRRVGKTALLQQFAEGRRTVFHTGAGRTKAGELALLSRQAAPVSTGLRDLSARPFADWDDALDALADAAVDAPLLVVLDEFPELVATSPELPGVIRAFLDRVGGRARLRLLLCGSAVRTMTALREERAPLYGRFGASVHLLPFTPGEASRMLPELSPGERAVVYGLVGGMPLYLSWWDQQAPVADNRLRLAGRPGAALLTEGQLVLATEVDSGDQAAAVLYAIAGGKTRYHEIKDQVRAEPARTLDRLIELRLVEKMTPVTETEHSRKRTYRIADNFLTFYLDLLSRYQPEIERGLGESIVPVLMESLDEHLGLTYEQAFRDHLRQQGRAGRLGQGIVAVGRWWRDAPSVEIDAVVLAGRSRRPVLAGEAKWARVVDGRRVHADLQAKARWLENGGAGLSYAICARDAVEHPPEGVMTVSAADIFRGEEH